MECFACKSDIPQQDAVNCGVCHNTLHLSCTDIKRKNDRKDWKCVNCRPVLVTTNPKVTGTVSNPQSPACSIDTNSPVALQTILLEIRDLAKSMNSCHEKLDVHTRLIEDQKKEIEKYRSENQQLHDRISVLEKYNCDLKSRVNEMEQYSRKNSVEIHGVPLPKKTSHGARSKEDTIAVVHRVGQAMGFKFEPYTIDACHRLGPSRNGQPPGIIVKFTRRVDKEDFLAKKKTRPQLSTRHVLGFEDCDFPIFVNESLSPYNRFLFMKAKEYKKVNNFKFCWVKNGHILLRKNESSNIMQVNSIDDLKYPSESVKVVESESGACNENILSFVRKVNG